MRAQNLAELRNEAQVTQRLWAKVLGMLQQNWCLIEARGKAEVDLVFFDDHGKVFDWLTQPNQEAAEAALRDNGFFWLHETPSFLHASGMPRLPEPGARSKVRPVYSSGKHWLAHGTDRGGGHARISIPMDRPADELWRFLDAQDPHWYDVVEQLAAGKKSTHWMWFVFPQLRGLGHSRMSQYFGLSSRREARDYWHADALGARLESCTQLLLGLPQNTSIESVLGHVDAMKLRSCMTLFEAVVAENDQFVEVIKRYFHGERCGQTREMARTEE